MEASFTFSVKATKQGDLKGEKGKDLSKIPILGFGSSVVSPLDPVSGLPTGKRQHKPLVVYKEWGVISPQLFQAMVTNENLPSVIIDEMRLDAKGKEFVYMEIHLINASIVEITVTPERSDVRPIWANMEIEQVAFTFQKIEIQNNVSKVMAGDDWEARV
jgi:type VI secretion system secreted protein Hcp